MAATGAVALYHIEGITPEARLMETKELEKIQVGEKEIKEHYASLTSHEKPDLIAIGCPHASLREIISIADKLRGKKLKKTLWIFTSRIMKDAALKMGLNDIIEAAGGKIVADTCMVVAPLEQMGFRTTGVNSGKAAHYLPGPCRQNVVFGNTADLIRLSC